MPVSPFDHPRLYRKKILMQNFSFNFAAGKFFFATVSEQQKRILNPIFLFSKVDTVAIQLLSKKVKTATIPDISGDADTPLGHISYSLSRYVRSDATRIGRDLR